MGEVDYRRDDTYKHYGCTYVRTHLVRLCVANLHSHNHHFHHSKISAPRRFQLMRIREAWSDRSYIHVSGYAHVRIRVHPRSTQAMWRDRLYRVIVVARTAFKWGWIPFIIYLGQWPLCACRAVEHVTISFVSLRLYHYANSRVFLHMYQPPGTSNVVTSSK